MDLMRPFTRADAVEAGIDGRILRTSRFKRLFRDVYVGQAAVDDQLRIRAALALHPGTAFASHHSAARIYGLPVPADSFEHVTVLHQEERRHRVGLKCHVVSGDPLVVEHRQMRISHPYRLFIEMAGKLDLVNLVVLGDAMVRVFAIVPGELVQACRESDRHHSRAALRGAEYVREGVDSVTESRLRMLIVLAGLPEPEVNHRIYAPNGRLLRRLDLSYPWLKLIIEYDGRQHAASTAQWGHDVDRREALDDDGWRILIVRSEGLYVSPETTLLRIRRQLVLRGNGRVPALRDNWRPYFEGTR